MRLTQWTDYTLRVLMYCAACQTRAKPVTISEIAERHGISRSHLTKIVRELSARALLQTTRGRGGGIRLALPAQEINLGAVVRATETDFALVECFDPVSNRCGLSRHCRLKSLLDEALQNYLAVLDSASLADLVPARGVAADASRPGPIRLVAGLPPTRD